MNYPFEVLSDVFVGLLLGQLHVFEESIELELDFRDNPFLFCTDLEKEAILKLFALNPVVNPLLTLSILLKQFTPLPDLDLHLRDCLKNMILVFPK